MYIDRCFCLVQCNFESVEELLVANAVYQGLLVVYYSGFSILFLSEICTSCASKDFFAKATFYFVLISIFLLIGQLFLFVGLVSVDDVNRDVCRDEFNAVFEEFEKYFNLFLIVEALTFGGILLTGCCCCCAAVDSQGGCSGGGGSIDVPGVDVNCVVS